MRTIPVLSRWMSRGELPSAEGIRYGYVDGKLQVTAAVQFGPVALELLLQYEQAEGL